MRLFLLLWLSVALILCPSAARAQLETFVQTVRELALTSSQPEPARSNGVRDVAARMQAALDGWDRNISALEAGASRERREASDLRTAQLHVQLGVAYRARGRIAEALREFDAAARLRPSGSDLRVLRALTLESVGRSAEAAQSFQDAWTLDPRNPVKAYYVAQRPFIDNAEREKARAFLRETYARVDTVVARPAAPPFLILEAIPDNLARSPVVGDETSAPAFGLLATEKYTEAVQALMRGDHDRSAKTDDTPRAHFVRGQSDEAENRVADARREYEAAVAGTLAGRSVIFVAISRLAQVEGDGAGAIDALNRAARLNPNDSLVHKELAAVLAAERRTDDAFMEIMAALLIDPRDAQAHAAIGQLDLDESRHADAVAAFSRALDLAPDRYEVRYGLATAYSRMGSSADAARQLELFERARRDALEQRRRQIEHDVEQEEAVRHR